MREIRVWELGENRSTFKTKVGFVFLFFLIPWSWKLFPKTYNRLNIPSLFKVINQIIIIYFLFFQNNLKMIYCYNSFQ